MNYHSKFPALIDLKKHAKRRIPHFVWEYLDSGTGNEETRIRNSIELKKILFYPSVLHGDIQPKLNIEHLGTEFSLPFGIAPVGMSGLIWPNAEKILAKAASIPSLLFPAIESFLIITSVVPAGPRFFCAPA